MRVLMNATLLTVLTVTSVLGQTITTGGSDWPQFRGNAHLNGVTAARVSDELSLAWTYDAGESIDSSASIVDGTVYVGSQLGELHAVDLETGKLRWKYNTGEPIGESSPAVHDGIVFIGDLGGTIHAVDAETGDGRWTFATESEVKSSPVVVDGKVLIGSYDTFLYALAEP